MVLFLIIKAGSMKQRSNSRTERIKLNLLLLFSVLLSAQYGSPPLANRARTTRLVLCTHEGFEKGYVHQGAILAPSRAIN